MNPLPSPLSNLTVAGKYRILLELGQGGTANVYLAVADGPGGFNKLVVLKCLKASLGEDEEFRQMFLNEARLSARLSHPNVVQVLEVTEHAGLPVIVMEYLDGASLSSLRARAGKRLTTYAHVRVLSDVLSALHYSHELLDYDGQPLNVVHRDMTPQNVFITQTGHVKLLDFGIAKLSGAAVETRAGLVKGKLRYMPPEQISGAELDRRTDVYAAGVILWEACVGTRMWSGLSDVAIMNRVLAGDIPTPSSVRPDVSAALERVCLKALAPKPELRFQSAEELRIELEQFMTDAAPSVRTRDVADLMHECFTEERERTRQIISQQLGHVSLSRSFGPGSITPVPTARDLGDRFSEVPTGVTIQEPISSRRKRRKSTLRVSIGAAAAGLVLALGGYAVFGHQPLVSKSSNATGTLAPPLGSREHALRAGSGDGNAAGSNQADVTNVVQRSRVRLRISAQPNDATLELDGTELAGNPAIVELPVAKSEHRLRVQAPGYVAEDLRFMADQDQEIALTLEPRPVRPATSTPPLRAQSQQAAQRTTDVPRTNEAPKPGETRSSDVRSTDSRPASVKPLEPAAPKPDCSTPFYVDERGIKKFNPACFR